MMPQIASADVPGFLHDLATKGIKSKTTRIEAGKIKPSQGEFNPDKIAKMMHKDLSHEKPILMSRDYYIIDGHHRWAAELNKNLKNKIAVYMVDLNVLELIKAARDYHKAFTKAIHEAKV